VKLRELTMAEVEFSIMIEDEDAPIKGAFATGDALEDARLECDIQRSLDQGDQWAWCTVKVIAEWREFRGLDCLGCCSYANETAMATTKICVAKPWQISTKRLLGSLKI